MTHRPLGIEGTSKELCEAIMTLDEKRMSTFLGKAVGAKILKSIAAQDQSTFPTDVPCCDCCYFGV